MFHGLAFGECSCDAAFGAAEQQLEQAGQVVVVVERQANLALRLATERQFHVRLESAAQLILDLACFRRTCFPGSW